MINFFNIYFNFTRAFVVDTKKYFGLHCIDVCKHFFKIHLNEINQATTINIINDNIIWHIARKMKNGISVHHYQQQMFQCKLN